jgi:hypothetical protein
MLPPQWPLLAQISNVVSLADFAEWDFERNRLLTVVTLKRLTRE